MHTAPLPGDVHHIDDHRPGASFPEVIQDMVPRLSIHISAQHQRLGHYPCDDWIKVSEQ